MKISNRLHVSTLFSIVTVFVVGAVIFSMFEQVNKASEEVMVAGAVVEEVFELNILTNDYLLYHE